MNLYVMMTALEFCGAICSFVILICMLILRRSEVAKSQYDVLFTMLFVMNALTLATDALARSYDGVSGGFARGMVIVMNFLEFGCNQALQVLFTMYLAKNFEQFVRVNGWRAIAWGVSGAYAVMLVANCFTGFLYTVDATNTYTHGPGYLFCYLPALILQLSNIWMIMKYRKRLPRVIQFLGLSIAWVPVIMAIPQVFLADIPWLRLTCFVLAVLTFFNVQDMFVEELRNQTRKQMQQEERMLVAQLQPHFLYNALLAIMGIEGNPPETVEAIGSFSRYLRGTLNSLRQEDTIPASQELKHVEAFVKLEQLRYGGRLQIQLDIAETGFYLPPLSLQMLVENAIRHGFSGMEEPGSLSITSKVLEDWYMVTVEDNGCGFDVDEIMNNPGTHVGLQSVRHRVEDMCGGQLIIRSTKNVGTRASIMIPRYEVRELQHKRVMTHHLHAEHSAGKAEKGREEVTGHENFSS